MNQDDKTS